METVSKGRLWAGRILSGIVVALILFGALFNLSGNPKAVEGAVQMGYPANTVTILGVAALLCAVLYAIPQTAVLGALFLTAYFGAAVATHIRAGQPLFWTLPAILMCTITWVGLMLREPRLAAILPVRR